MENAAHPTASKPSLPLGQRWARYVRSRGLALGILLLVVQLAVLAGAEADWRIDLFSHFQVQQFFGGAALLALVAGTLCFVRPRRPLDGLLLLPLAAGTALACASVWDLWPKPPAPPAAAAGQPLRLKLLHANVFRDNYDTAPLLALIRQRQPDVILLQEVTTVWKNGMKAVAATHPHSCVNPDDEGCFGMGLWSRWPLHGQQWTMLDSLMPHLRTKIETPAGPLRFFGVHPLPPMNSLGAGDRAKCFADLAAQTLSREPGSPLLIVRDLNCTRFSPHFGRLCRDAGVCDLAAELKLQRTWPAGPLKFWLGLRIDHVLGDAGWRTAAVEVGPDIGSDHYPVFVELER